MGDKITNTAVQIDAKDGVATIEQGTPLTRLHYFDGKFLRADALTLEQEYHRTLVRMANLAGGWGVVHGLGISVAANLLTVTPGLAITPAGSTVLLSNPVSVEVAKLMAAASPAPATPGAPGTATFHDCQPGTAAPTATSPGVGYYEITVGPLEGLCGNEEVYGKLCEDACVTDSQSPYWKEGMLLRLRPITLPLAAGSAVPPAAIHLRNRVASSYFAAEPWLTASLLSGAGLASSAWCNPATLYNRDEVPIGLLVQEGATTRFIDAWSARRERMDTQARGYWQGRMMMRPWNVFLAQILQFQCQLPGIFTPGAAAPDDDCQDLRDLLRHSLKELRAMQQQYADSSKQILQMLGQQGVQNQEQFAGELSGANAQLDKLTATLADAQDNAPALPGKRLLINAGFLDLPPAGYLPVDPTRPTVNDQLKRFFGEGVALFFCTARPDYIPHAVEEVQHMERISLTRGLDDPAQREEVEVFVPNGQIVDSTGSGNGTYWHVAMMELLVFQIIDTLDLTMQKDAATTNGKPIVAHAFDTSVSSRLAGMTLAAAADAPPVLIQDGVMRTARIDTGGAVQTLAYRRTNPAPLPGEGNHSVEMGGYADWRILEDPFGRQEGDQITMQFEQGMLARMVDGSQGGVRIWGGGPLTIQSMYQVDNQTVGLDGVADLQLQMEESPYGPTSRFGGRTRIKLLRQGDARSGRLLLFPAPSGDAQVRLEWLMAWQGKPRAASLRVVSTPLGNTAAGSIRKNAAASPGTSATDENSMTIATMEELTASLQPEHPLRLAALNVLTEMAGVMNDPAFLARARRNLFPDTAVTTDEILVRATLDWVMFRRRRHADCDRRCQGQVETPPVTMQVWHVRLTSTKLIEALVAAIDADNLEAAKLFVFERVDILHYADARSSPQEAVDQIVQDWQAHNPGNTGILARAWASTPALQSEPLLARLTRFCATVNGDTSTPPADSLRVLSQPPAALADAQFGGGLLLASYDRQEQDPSSQLQHRVYLIERGNIEKATAILDQGGKDIAKFLEQAATFAGALGFVAGVPDADQLKNVVNQFQQLAGARSGEATLLVSSSGTDAAAMKANHQAVVKALNLKVGKRIDVDEPDFGNGTPGATLVYFRQG